MSAHGHKRLALVTGGNAGIGLETCRGLLDAGFHVIVTARTQPKADDAIADLLATAPPGSTAEALILDLASLDSVQPQRVPQALEDFKFRLAMLSMMLPSHSIFSSDLEV